MGSKRRLGKSGGLQVHSRAGKGRGRVVSDDIEMFDEWADGVNVRALIATKNERIAELEARIQRLARALEELLSWSEAKADDEGRFANPGHLEAINAARRALSGEPK